MFIFRKRRVQNKQRMHLLDGPSVRTGRAATGRILFISSKNVIQVQLLVIYFWKVVGD